MLLYGAVYIYSLTEWFIYLFFIIMKSYTYVDVHIYTYPFLYVSYKRIEAGSGWLNKYQSDAQKVVLSTLFRFVALDAGFLVFFCSCKLLLVFCCILFAALLPMHAFGSLGFTHSFCGILYLFFSFTNEDE